MSNLAAGEDLSGLMWKRPAGRDAAVTDAAPVWLAAYTTPRHEKVVARHLAVREVEHYPPLYRAVRRWKNGCKVPVDFPVFPNYIFVRTGPQSSSRLLEIPGLVMFVGSGRRATPLPDGEMEQLRTELSLRKFEPHPYLTVGSKVRIVAGPLAGYQGILQLRKSAIRVVISVELIRQSVAVEVHADEVELV